MLTAFYLRYGTSSEGDTDESVVRVLAGATWKQDESGTMVDLKLRSLDDSGSIPLTGSCGSPDFISSWRKSVEPGWHGFLSAANLGEVIRAA